MKVTKDLLNALDIESVYIKVMDEFTRCMPVEFRPAGWLAFSDGSIGEGKVCLKIKYRGSFFPIMAEASEIQEENGLCRMFLTFTEEEKNRDEFKKAFFLALGKMMEKGEAWNKRKEERYQIGLDEAEIERMQFKGKEHILIEGNRQIPCVVDNVSYNGARLVIFDGNVRTDTNTYLMLKYKNPIEQIGIMCLTRNIQRKILGGGKKIQIISVEYKSVPLEYNYRLDAYIEKRKGRNMSV